MSDLYQVYKRPAIITGTNNIFGGEDWRPAHLGLLTKKTAEALEVQLKASKDPRWLTEIKRAEP